MAKNTPVSGVGAGVKTDSQGCGSHTRIVCPQAVQQGDAGAHCVPQVQEGTFCLGQPIHPQAEAELGMSPIQMFYMIPHGTEQLFGLNPLAFRDVFLMF